MRIRICDFTQRELYMLRRTCNFTPEELTIFNLRSKGLTLSQCAEEMHYSTQRVNRIVQKMLDKVERVCCIQPKKINI